MESDGQYRHKSPLPLHLTVSQVKRMLRLAMPVDAAEMTKNMTLLRYGSPEQVDHLTADLDPAPMHRLLLDIAACAPTTRLAAVMRKLAANIQALAESDQPRLPAIAYLASIAMSVFHEVEWTAEAVSGIDSARGARTANHPGRERLWRVSRAPLWALTVLSAADPDELDELTPTLIVERADIKPLDGQDPSGLLAEATVAIQLFRLMNLLAVVPSWITDLLRHVIDEDLETEAAAAPEYPSGPRPAPDDPPGQLITAAPRIPRGPSAERSLAVHIVEGRGRLRKPRGSVAA
ncbi:hypothetical protein ABZW10_13345 [Kitasatospora sp. NPDC004723]|uniref:hypothetical protein n=1 Tax=Kitasatospora sp. NPDC004723 TaxID=3154288 RepID=UPI0033B0B732